MRLSANGIECAEAEKHFFGHLILFHFDAKIDKVFELKGLKVVGFTAKSSSKSKAKST